MFLSVIIPICNNPSQALQCIHSIIAQKKTFLEIIVIDNSVLEQRLKDQLVPAGIIVIKNTENKGASCARNQGLAMAKGRYVMFLDSDAYVADDFFSRLEKILDKLPESVVGISPKILHQGTSKIFSCGLAISSLYRVFDVGRDQRSDICMNPFPIDGINTCCSIVRRDCLDEITDHGSYFDEDFFFLFEDADISLRLQLKGYQFMCVPELICYHEGGGAKIPVSYRRFLCFRNRLYLIFKMKQKKGLMVFFCKSVFYDFLRTFHFALSNRYFLRACCDIVQKIRKIKSVSA